MINLIKNAVQLSVYHIARGTAAHLHEKMKKEDINSRDFKNKMLIISTVNALLGILYND